MVGFLGVIMAGTFLLMLPFSSKTGDGTAFMDALFTATSAVCVTGLVVQDTATYWSMFGQLVILLLIQIGGLGVITVALCFSMISKRKISLMQRDTMKEAIAAPSVGGIVQMTHFILKYVIIIEALGAIALSTVFCKEFGLGKGLWYSVFHSISAFCNAGFDLMGIKSHFSSIVDYQTDPIVNITIMALIIIGGIGFFTWEDIKKNKRHIIKYRMQSKVILTTTAILIVLPSLYYFIFEFQNLPLQARIWSSLFQSVTPRTAGFNTVDLTGMSEVGLLIMMMLMLIGGSPGSTAGGMKTTTIAVLFSNAFSVFRHKADIHFFERKIPDNTIKDSSTLLMLYVILFLSGGVVICKIEQIPLLTALFETASAIGTVGLTLGVTPDLCLVSRSILILLMFIGRVGGLTFIFATVSGKNNCTYKYPQEKISVG